MTTQPNPPRRWQFIARPIRAVDGDTIICEMLLRDEEDLGFYVQTDKIRRPESLRLKGVKCPELFTGTDRIRGQLARDFTETWLFTLPPMPDGYPLDVETFKLKDGVTNLTTFNRYVATVRCRATQMDLAEAIIAANHGVRAT
jgi:endonuclease YncB( thermonuclease family)